MNPVERGRLALWRFREGEYWWLRRSHSNMNLTMYSGLPGSGKTLLLVQDAVKLLRRGEDVYSNLYIRDRLTGRESKPCHSWLDMLRIAVEALENGRSAWFAWDELHLWADARAWAATPPFLLTLFAERRHYRIGLLGSTQHLDQVDKRLRTLVDKCVECRPHLLRRVIRSVTRREFPLLAVEVLDGRLIDAVAAGTRTADEAVLEKGMRWIPWWAWSSYSTHEIVLGEDLRDYKQAAVLEEIAELEARAEACMEPEPIEAFSERWDDIDADWPVGCPGAGADRGLQ